LPLALLSFFYHEFVRLTVLMASKCKKIIQQNENFQCTLYNLVK
jgi:hypothetical protein